MRIPSLHHGSTKSARWKLTALAAVTAAMLVLAGCGSDDAGTDDAADDPSSTAASPSDSPTSDEATSEETTSPSPESTSGSETASPDGLETAAKAALGEVPNSTLISIETADAQGQWEVQVVTGDGTEHELVITSDGEVVRGPTTDDDDSRDKAKHRRRVADAKLDYQAAAEKLRQAVADARLTELNLDTYRGDTVWEGDLVEANGTKHEVKVDAGSGRVLDNRATTRDDVDDED